MKKNLLFTFVIVFVFLINAAVVSAIGEIPDMNNGQLLISEAGTYRLIGNMRGTVLIDPGQGDVRLIMDNFSINGGPSAGIIALSGDSLTVELADNSYNRVMDGTRNTGYNAAIFSRISTSFEGNGSLDLFGYNQGAIRVENADLSFNGGNYQIVSPDNAINVNGNQPGMLFFDNGSFLIQSGNNSFSPETNVVFNGGNIRQMDFNGNSSMLVHNATENNLPNALVTDASVPQHQNQPENYFVQDVQPFSQQASHQQNQPSFNQPGNNSSFQQPDVNDFNGQPGQENNSMGQPGIITGYESAGSPTEIVYGTSYNSAMDLTADYDNATTYDVSDSSTVKISESGTYIVTGTSSDGSITVTKGTTGVVLVLEDLDLTSTSGATLSVNKQAEVQIIISGNVTLTDAEDPANEDSDDFDGAALKVKAESKVYITGDGQLTINGNAKNGIKGGDDSSIIIDGPKLEINAANDGINTNYDVTILSGDITINAADDAIHADHILTIGKEDGTGPKINVKTSNEGLEGTVVNIFGGDITINSTDDAINAANGDGIYEGVLDYSINMTGGSVTIKSQGDGLDSNGNINLIGGSASISSASNGGEAGIDYDGQLYISNDFQLNNNSGVAGPDNMPGSMNGQNMGPMNNDQQGGFTQDFSSQPSFDNNGFAPDFGGQPAFDSNNSAPDFGRQPAFDNGGFDQGFGSQDDFPGGPNNRP